MKSGFGMSGTETTLLFSETLLFFLLYIIWVRIPGGFWEKAPPYGTRCVSHNGLFLLNGFPLRQTTASLLSPACDPPGLNVPFIGSTDNDPDFRIRGTDRRGACVPAGKREENN